MENRGTINKYISWIKHDSASFTKKNSLIIFALIVLVIVSTTLDNFLTVGNLMNIITQIGATALMAFGLTSCLIVKGTDLSLPAVMALSAVLGADVMVKSGNVFLGILVMLCTGILCGLVNGIAVARFNMVPMIVTLSMQVVAQGISVWYTKSESIIGIPESFTGFVNYKIFGYVSTSVVIMIGCAVVLHLLLKKTAFGRSMFAIGTNIETAKVSGIHTRRINISAYVISGLCAGIAGLLMCARLKTAGPAMGPSTLFIDIAIAAVVGGARLEGGHGSVIGTLFGATFVACISNIMTLLNVEFFMTMIFKGFIVVLVIWLDALKSSTNSVR